ncbi:MAG TPA: aminoglycoside phosphotransferase family protein, partial [Pseudonocardiaceae bacterium]|nr:aminoglycoside phosphotransferase family protein [Pseudonocardiaceae bacterium]
APAAEQVAQFEIDIAQRLAEGPVAALAPGVAPRVHERDGFVITLWTYYAPTVRPEIAPADYATALRGLHVGMRTLDMTTPHFTDRVEEAQRLVAGRDLTPGLGDADRELLGDTLDTLRRAIGERGAAEQVLHGEPHPGNLLATANGPLFIDFETCCRGPVEFDLAHAPDEISEHYPNVDQDLLRECRLLKLAMITAWRWDRGDQFPNGYQLGIDGLSQIRAALDVRR